MKDDADLGGLFSKCVEGQKRLARGHGISLNLFNLKAKPWSSKIFHCRLRNECSKLFNTLPKQ